MTARKVIRGKRVLFPDGSIRSAAIIVQFGRIQSIQEYDYPLPADVSEVVEGGELLVMAGVVDSHVHVNEPGRTHWEGYHTATRAAAAGGITTIVDMPLNSIPATVSVDALNSKLQAASGQCFVDVGFWGGVIPNNEMELRPMLRAGVCGFKCFLVDSGVDEFPMVTEKHLHDAMKQLQGTGAVLLFHAELECGCSGSPKGEASEYNVFLESRPEEMEIEAIKLVCQLSQQYQVRCHIVHLSAAGAIPLLRAARAAGAPVTVETTHHYLYLDAATVPAGATQYKCVPPIRSKQNQDGLWAGIKSGDIDLVISDHSPCPADLKLLDTGDFLKAWGGIASVQFGLSLLWSNAQAHGLGLADIQRLLCSNPALLAGLSGKGAIKVGNDADFVIWDPDNTFTVVESEIEHKHKVTPYLGRELRGVVHRTIVRGNTVFRRDRQQGERVSEPPLGTFVFSYIGTGMET